MIALRSFAALAVWSLLAPTSAMAHPHEWIDARFEILFDASGVLLAIYHHWRLDEGFTAFAIQGLDTDEDGEYSSEELQPLADENIESLKDFEYFTVVRTGSYRAGFAAPKEYRVALEDNAAFPAPARTAVQDPGCNRGAGL